MSKPRAFIADWKSSGRGASNWKASLSWDGCFRDNFAAWRACLLIHGPVIPYRSSPRMQCPKWARWTRIWCVLPVLGWHSIREHVVHDLKRFSVSGSIHGEAL